MNSRIKFFFIFYLFIGCLLTPQFLQAMAVELKDGQYLQGEIIGHDDQGFEFKRWDNEGVVYIYWYHLPPREITRLKNFLNVQPAEEKTKGYRVYTAGSEIFEGVPVEDSAEKLVLKNINKTRTFSKKEILKTETVELDLFAVYTKDELYQEKNKKYDLNRGVDNYNLAQYCRDVLIYYVLAEKHFRKAADLDPSLQNQVNLDVTGLEKIELNQEIQKIMKFLRENDIKSAKEVLQTIKNTFDLTNSDLNKIVQQTETAVSALEQQVKENRQKGINKKIINDWHKELKSLLRKTAGNTRLTYSDAIQYVANLLKKELVKKLADDYEIIEKEVETIWANRDLKEAPQKTAGYGDGSWILFRLTAPDNSTIEEFAKYREKIRLINNARRLAADKNKLLTSDVWWEQVSPTTKEKWLEAYFAERQMTIVQVKKENCSNCQGEGVLKSKNNELCDRCQGETLEVTVIYQ